MKFFTVFAFIATLMLAEALLPKVLQKKLGYLDTVEFNQRAQRIVNGEKAKKGDAPFQTSLQKDYFGIMKSHICGGSFINKRTIVTAAHCTDGQKPTDIVNRFGTLNNKKPGDDGDRKSQRLIMHEKYDPNTIENDIALIIVDKDVSPSENVAFVDYDKKMVDGGVDVTVTGWGLTTGGSQNVPDDMMIGYLKSMTNDDCHKMWGDVNPIKPGMLCAMDRNGVVGAAGTTACNGDSGGPLVENRNGKKFLVGLVSWGENGCKGNYPNVYTRVSEYVDWINTHKQN